MFGSEVNEKVDAPWDNVRHLTERVNPNIMFITRIYDTSLVGSLVSLFQEMIEYHQTFPNKFALIWTMKGWLLESIRAFL
jgi:hypothetical protein